MKPEQGYLTADTTLPQFIPYPKFLFCMELTDTAKLLYALLLDRAMLSQANDWIDENGRIYLVFPIQKMAETMGKSPMTVKNALKELDSAGLLERKRQGFSAPNRLYVKYPPEVKISVPMTDKKLSVTSTETCLNEGQETVLMMDRKLSPNQLTYNQLNSNQLNRVSDARAAPLGKYQNIFLTENEQAELKAEFPAEYEDYIKRVSQYIASSGKRYQNHAATIRYWITKDREKPTKKKRGIPDYSFKEGESL